MEHDWIIVLVSVSTVEKKCCDSEKEWNKRWLKYGEKTPIEIFRKIEVKNNKLQLDEQLNEFAFFWEWNLRKSSPCIVVNFILFSPDSHHSFSVNWSKKENGTLNRVQVSLNLIT